MLEPNSDKGGPRSKGNYATNLGPTIGKFAKVRWENKCFLKFLTLKGNKRKYIEIATWQLTGWQNML